MAIASRRLARPPALPRAQQALLRLAWVVSLGDDAGLGFASSTGTGGSTVGRNVSSFGVNFAASSGEANSIAAIVLGMSLRAGHAANISRDVANCSELSLRNFSSEVN